jgi:hypothetical protein
MKRILLMAAAAVLLCAPARAAGPGAVAPDEDGKAWLGVMLQDVTPQFAKKHDLAVKEGAYVSSVVDDSPADSAGIEDGDVIIEFSGKKIADAQALVKAVAAAKPGEAVPLVFMRGKERRMATVTLARAEARVRVVAKGIELPDLPALPAPRTFSVFTGASCCGSAHGMKLSTLGAQLGKYFGAPDGKGVLVEDVKPDSKADKGGFTAGDVILKAGKKTVVTVRDFTAAFGAYDDGETIPVEILRKGARQTLNLEVKAGAEGCDTLFDVGEGSLRLRHLPERGDCEDLRFESGALDDAMKELRIELQRGKDEYDDAVKQYRIQLRKSARDRDDAKREIIIRKRVESDDI